MDRSRKLELIQRSLGIRHKLKVHDTATTSTTHEDLAMTILTRWELEDELRAIEEILADTRHEAVAHKRSLFESGEMKVSFEREARST